MSYLDHTTTKNSLPEKELTDSTRPNGALALLAIDSAFAWRRRPLLTRSAGRERVEVREALIRATYSTMGTHREQSILTEIRPLSSRTRAQIWEVIYACVRWPRVRCKFPNLRTLSLLCHTIIYNWCGQVETRPTRPWEHSRILQNWVAAVTRKVGLI